MAFVETALGIGALLGGASSAGSAISSGSMNRKNRKWQEKMYKWQLQDNRDNTRAQWQENRDYAKWLYDNYESPSAQRAAMKAAGINPFVQGSAIQPMNVQSGTPDTAEGGSVPSQGPYQNNPMSNIQAGASSLREFAMQQVQSENIQAQTEYTNAQRLKTLAETKGIENTNSLFDFVRSAAESDTLSRRFRARIDQVNAEFAEIKAIQDAAERDARIAELWSREEKNLADAAKTDADRLTVNTLRDGMKKLQDAQIENTESDTAYKRVLASVEDAKLKPFLEEMQARIRNLDQSTLTEQQRTDLTGYEADLKRILARHERGEMREFLRRLETTGRSVWRLILPSIGG